MNLTQLQRATQLLSSVMVLLPVKPALVRAEPVGIALVGLSEQPCFQIGARRSRWGVLSRQGEHLRAELLSGLPNTVFLKAQCHMEAAK